METDRREKRRGTNNAERADIIRSRKMTEAFGEIFTIDHVFGITGEATKD